MAIHEYGSTRGHSRTVPSRFGATLIEEPLNVRPRILAIMLVCAISCIPGHARVPPRSHEQMHFIARGGERYGLHFDSRTTNRRWAADTGASVPGRPVPWRRDPQGRNADLRRQHRTLGYKEILDCDVRQWSSTGTTTEQPSTDTPQISQEKQSANPDHSFVDYRGRLEGDHKQLSHSPVVYQYYGRSRIRGNPSDAVHFILLGPNVDHWKAVGQILASRGFNTIACERLEKGNLGAKDDKSDDTPNLVLDLMEALKWKKVILVGCDSESILAMETAMMLSPDQVVGLVISGDLSGANQAATEARVGGLDSFLQRVLDCPYLIVWEGDSPTIISGSSAHRALETESSDRCVILGGGSAPHRIKPEQFAWVLTRFVEEKLSIAAPKELSTPRTHPVVNKNSSGQRFGAGRDFLRALRLPFGINTLVSPEGRLLLGRAFAAVLFYVTAMRVVFVQYGILRSGLFAIKSKYDSIDALTKRSFQAVGAFVVNFGYIPRLFTLKRANDDEEDDARRSGTIVLKNQEPAEEGTESGTGVEQGDTEVVGDGAEDNNGGTLDERKGDHVGKPLEDDTDLEPSPRFKPFFFLDNVVT
jgi:hypothetical protein